MDEIDEKYKIEKLCMNFSYETIVPGLYSLILINDNFHGMGVDKVTYIPIPIG